HRLFHFLVGLEEFAPVEQFDAGAKMLLNLAHGLSRTIRSAQVTLRRLVSPSGRLAFLNGYFAESTQGSSFESSGSSVEARLRVRLSPSSCATNTLLITSLMTLSGTGSCCARVVV